MGKETRAKRGEGGKPRSYHILQEEKQALGGTGARELGATRIPVEPDGSRVTGKKAGHGEISV